MQRFLIAALASLIIVSGCTSAHRQTPSATASHPFTHFVDPVTEETPHVQIDLQ